MKESTVIRVGVVIAILYIIVFIITFVKTIQEDLARRDIKGASYSYTLVSSSTEFHVIDNQTKDTIYTERMNYPSSSNLQEALIKNQE